MKDVASRSNPVFKSLRKLAQDPSARRDAGIALIEGEHLCMAFADGAVALRRLVVGSSAIGSVAVADLIERLGSRLPASEQYRFDDGLYDTLSSTGSGARVMLEVAVPRPDIPARIDRTAVFLDRVQDPGNVGSILRSAAAAGIGAVYASRQCAQLWSPKVVRAGMGAHVHLRLFDDCDLDALRPTVEMPWIATSPHAAESLYETDLDCEVAWVFGHEGQGLDEGLLNGALHVAIPQPGHGESLNVAAAAAVCFFEQVRQRAAASRSLEG